MHITATTLHAIVLKIIQKMMFVARPSRMNECVEYMRWLLLTIMNIDTDVSDMVRFYSPSW